MESTQHIPVAILCGGKGTRLKEETEFRPKPMIMIGDRPIVWHIMKIYSYYGFSDFMLCLGYKGEMLREYFFHYEWNHNDILLEMGTKRVSMLRERHEEKNWKIWMLDTGQESMTGGRLKRLSRYMDQLGSDIFLATYGDGVGNINVRAVLEFHKQHGKMATITAVRPPARFGELVIQDNVVRSFKEKPQTSEGWINGGFFVLDRKVLDLIAGDETVFEAETLPLLSEMGELSVYQHDGFWQCMDTYREMELLNDLKRRGQAPWEVWK